MNSGNYFALEFEFQLALVSLNYRQLIWQAGMKRYLPKGKITCPKRPDRTFLSPALAHQCKLEECCCYARKSNLSLLVAAACFLQGLTCKDLDCLPFGVAVPIREALHQSAADPPLTLPTGAYQLIGE